MNYIIIWSALVTTRVMVTAENVHAQDSPFDNAFKYVRC